MDNPTRSQIQLPTPDTRIHAQVVYENHGTFTQSVMNISPFPHNHGGNTTLDNTMFDKQEEPNVVLPSTCAHETSRAESNAFLKALFQKLSILDRLLTPAILLAMIIGVIIGEFVPRVQQAFNTARFDGVSVPIALGLIIMMWPVLTKVQYEAFPKIFSSSRIWVHIGLSMILNWIVGPFVMLGLAWMTLPDLPTYRTGVIMVGLARCIAMVMIWNRLARGDSNYCAILVVVNSVLQIVLYSPYALLFINVISRGRNQLSIHVSYNSVAISVLIYLGIPLLAGVATRYTVWYFTSRPFLDKRFLPLFSPLSLVGLLYTIVVMFSNQGHHIVHNIGSVFRVLVPMILYFVIMWSSAFALVFYLTRREFQSRKEDRHFGYDMAVVQAFTAGSNNFELAIAVAIAVYGIDSDQALAATIGPLVEVPVLLALTWVALWFGKRLNWKKLEDSHVEGSSNEA